MGLWRSLAVVALALDRDQDGDVDIHDFLDGDHDGRSDVIGVLLMIIKVLTILLCILAWNSIRVSWKLKEQKKKPRRELLIFACSPKLAPLPNAVVEATEVSRVFDASIYARDDVTAKELQSALLAVPTRRFLFIGHADAPMEEPRQARQVEARHVEARHVEALRVARHGPPKSIFNCRTLGFVTQDGHLSAVVPTDLARLLGRHGVDRGGALEMVFLNGCKSEPLARAVVDAGVPLVVCWKTKAHDGAARLFSKAFFEALAHLRPSAKQHLNLVKYVQAFREAVDSILFETRPGTLANGVVANVPTFEIRDPNDGPSASSCSPPPLAAGLPWFVCSRPLPPDCLADASHNRSLKKLFHSLSKCRRRTPAYLAVPAPHDDGVFGVVPSSSSVSPDADDLARRSSSASSASIIAKTLEGALPHHRSQSALPR